MPRLFHAVEIHKPNARDEKRVRRAQESWGNLKGVTPCHYRDYVRDAAALGDRKLPFLKDVLHHAMTQAADSDIIILTNDDVWLHPELPDLLRFHVPVYDCCSAQRLDYADANSVQGERHIGRDLFAFTKAWLVSKWSEIPDFILGCSEWDLCLAGMIRNHHGISLARFPIANVIHPSEIPVGYVTHTKHVSEWMHPTYVDSAPAQLHNKRLFREWREHYAQPKRPQLTIRRSAALGDALAATCVADKLIDMGYDVVFQCVPAVQPLIRRHPRIKAVTNASGHCDIDLDGSYESDPDRTRKHFATMFIERANQQLAGIGVVIPKVADIAPRIRPGNKDVMAHFASLPRPWVMICPRSGSWLNRTVPNHIWQKACGLIPGTKFFLSDDVPLGRIKLPNGSMDDLVDRIACADLLISPDTGPAHIAIALGVPAVVIGQSSDPALHFSDQRDWIGVYPPLDCLNCMKPHCPLDAAKPPCQDIAPVAIAEAVNARLRQYSTDDVSAVVCVYKPEVGRLNKCLEAVLPQVQEIVVVGNLDTAWPIAGALQNPKIRYVQRQAAGVGYSRNVNLGVRHTNGKWLYLVNDDCYPRPDVIQKLLAIAKADDKVGAVTHLLMYSGGRGIQYAGKFRVPGGMGFGHIDHHGHHSRYTSPHEEESVCGASMLVRRKAYFDVDGYGESWKLYSEDDDMALKLRQAGWKLIFEPRAVGIHDEHQSTSKVSGLPDILRESSAAFARKWAFYFQRNPNPNVVGTFT